MIVANNAGQSALYSGLQGYKQGEQMVNKAANEIATQQPSQAKLNQNAVDMTAGSLQAQASAAVIKRADEMVGSIIDTVA